MHAFVRIIISSVMFMMVWNRNLEPETLQDGTVINQEEVDTIRECISTFRIITGWHILVQALLIFSCLCLSYPKLQFEECWCSSANQNRFQRMRIKVHIMLYSCCFAVLIVFMIKDMFDRRQSKVCARIEMDPLLIIFHGWEIVCDSVYITVGLYFAISLSYQSYKRRKEPHILT